MATEAIKSKPAAKTSTRKYLHEAIYAAAVKQALESDPTEFRRLNADAVSKMAEHCAGVTEIFVEKFNSKFE